MSANGQTPFIPEVDARFAALEAGTGVTGFAAAQASIAAILNGFLTPTTETSTTDTGALSLTKMISYISAAGAQTRTLAAPAADGQFKVLVMTVHGGDATIAMTNFDHGTTLTFAAINKFAVLFSANSKWLFVGGTAAIT